MKKYILVLTMLSMIIILTGCKTSSKDDSKENISPAISASPAPTAALTDAPAIPDVTSSPEADGKEPSLETDSPGPSPEADPSGVSDPSDSSDPASSSDYASIADNIIRDMTLEEKVGQLFFVRCRRETAEADIKKYQPGGYILFAPDFTDGSRESVSRTIHNYQKLSALPLLIGVDEEGGTVNRISRYPAFRSEPFRSPQELYAEGGMDRIASDTLEKAQLLKSLGINVNLAPVCDISVNPEDFIYRRSFGQDADATAEYVKTVVEAMYSERIGSTLKHFPGYGNNADTHTGIAIDDRSLESFYEYDFLPFKAGIAAGAGSILVSHNIVNSMDPDYPASLSAKVHRILREELEFDGVVMTDDLSMEAVTGYTNHQAAAILAIQAGNDLVVASDYQLQIPAVIDAVKNRTISEDQINDAVKRVLIWKLSLQLEFKD